MSDKYAVKLTVTFNDGDTEDFDVFIAVGAEGLIPAGREGTQVLYTADENLKCIGMARIAATSDVIVALMKASMGLISNMLDSVPPELIPGFLDTVLSLSTKRNILYHKAEVVSRKQG